ncbi:putative Transposase, partial [Globisporangium splendens]
MVEAQLARGGDLSGSPTTAAAAVPFRVVTDVVDSDVDDSSVDQDDDNNATAFAPTTKSQSSLAPYTGRKRGRQQSEIWALFTDDANPQTLKAARCKHCHTIIKHHRKSESAKTHLNKCVPFRQLMSNQESDELPPWYVAVRKPRRRSVTKVTPTKTAVTLPSVAQSPMKNDVVVSAVDHTKERELFQRHMAMHYYAMGIPFDCIEDGHLARAIAVLRPEDKELLPDNRMLATELLSICYNDIKGQVETHLADSVVCLATNSWYSAQKDPVVKYAATLPDACMFLESVAAGKQGSTAAWIVKDIERVFRGYASTKFAGAVTDNTSAHKKAWQLLSDKFPSCYFQGCCSHALDLMIKDIFSAVKTKTKKAGATEATYPDDGYPFEDMLEFVADCKDVVKFFHNDDAVKAQLQEVQKAAGLRPLVEMAPTRWGTLQLMCQRLLDSEVQMHAIVRARDFVAGTAAEKAERTRIKAIVSNDQFVAMLEKALAILKPIDALIVKYESERVAVSEVLPDFEAFPEQFQQVFDDGLLSASELEYLVNLSEFRFQFMYGAAHGLAYLLDPRFLGKDLPAAKRQSLEEILINTPVGDEISSDDENKEALYMQFTNFFIAASQERAKNTFRYQMLAKKRKTPLQYWIADGYEWPLLQQVAIKLFSMAASSAASEKSFASASGAVHSSTLSRCLSAKSVEKLVFMKSNMRTFYDSTSVETENNKDNEDINENLTERLI